ncbi:MAG: amino acid--[acyl-carrier-protein] ligase [Proteobacteria bacterium]|uniref:amino acid--[acyl-carrier-protein] ligase n=1 Tax=Rudaea sp. TaxID=2136325 RepID=UPI001DCC6A93|nr:amino acid--[acyl-carrier-protein] ligase [Pseudomonadota bacterium]MBS0568140.1 amino acid--[acyl-carrier-protein] ligase [Pseudomonadota bacterium]
MPATDYDARKFHEGLVKHGLIVPVGVQGIFGRSRVFEDVLEHFNALVTDLAKDDGAEYFVFPPTIDRKVLEKSDYMDSFPNLAGTVFSFQGKELTARQLSEAIHAGESWEKYESMTDVVLNPAACYPVYPSFSGTVPKEGRLVTMFNWVFRNEPSPEPTRMQSFRVREFVRCGTPAQVVEWRDMWLKRGLALLESLGLPVQAEVASDPFFGKGGKMLAVSQREQQLKFEVLVPVISKEKPTAVCSFNYHQEHFGEAFAIRTEDGKVANTACLGFGLERLVMALFQTHGFDPGAWPSAVRAKLWP